MSSEYPTVKVTAIAYDSEGNPRSNARVIAILTTVERYNGFVLPNVVETVTDSDGRAVLELFPNELGSEGSEYRFFIENETGKSVSLHATVPNMDCDLWRIADLDPYEKRGAGEILTSEIAAMVEQATAARDEAISNASAASASAINAENYANAAQAAMLRMEDVSATAITLPPGSDATASYDPATAVFSLGIPKGDQGEVSAADLAATNAAVAAAQALMGALANLTTTEKDTLVAAINEVFAACLHRAGGVMTGTIKSSISPALSANALNEALRICGSNDWNKGARIALHPASGSGMVYISSIKTDGTDAFISLELNANTGGLRWDGASLIVKSATVYEQTVSLTQNTSTTITITNPSDKVQHLAFIVRECWPGTTHANAGVIIERVRSATQLDVVSHSVTQNYSLKIDEIYLKKFA